MCTNRLFSEGGMIGLLEQAAELFREVLLYLYVTRFASSLYQNCNLVLPKHAH